MKKKDRKEIFEQILETEWAEAMRTITQSTYRELNTIIESDERSQQSGSDYERLPGYTLNQLKLYRATLAERLSKLNSN